MVQEAGTAAKQFGKRDKLNRSGNREARTTVAPASPYATGDDQSDPRH